MSTLPNVAFLGLGHMGGPMAANLVKAGYPVTGYDPVPAAQEQGRADGLTIVESATFFRPTRRAYFGRVHESRTRLE